MAAPQLGSGARDREVFPAYLVFLPDTCHILSSEECSQLSYISASSSLLFLCSLLTLPNRLFSFFSLVQI